MKHQRHGRGSFFYPDGSKYEGDWNENIREGHGVYTYANNDAYEGEWKNHRKHGRGTYSYSIARTATAELHRSQPRRYVFASVSLFADAKYVGTWRDGKRHGPGEMQYGAYRYVGNFDDNRVSSLVDLDVDSD